MEIVNLFFIFYFIFIFIFFIKFLFEALQIQTDNNIKTEEILLSTTNSELNKNNKNEYIWKLNLILFSPAEKINSKFILDIVRNNNIKFLLIK